MKRALLILTFAGMVLATKACLEWIDGTDAPAVANGCCEDWVPCPGREPIKEGKRRLIWYCARPLDGDEVDGRSPAFARESTEALGAGPAKGRSEKRAAGSRGCAPRGG